MNSSCFFTTAYDHFKALLFLHTGSVSFKWIPHLNIVHQIISDLEISSLFFPHLMMQTKCLYWFSSSLISLILCSTTAAADHFGRNFSSFTFNDLSSWVLVVVVFESHSNTIEYSSWIGLSIMLFPERFLVDLIVLSLLMKIFSIISIFRFPRLYSSLFIITNSLMLIFTGFS